MSFRGYEIHEEDAKWFFSDTAEPVSCTWKHRPCGYCGMLDTHEGYDNCFGHLPGVMNACCGHGESKSAYIQFAIGLILKGFIALWIGYAMKRLKKL